MKAKSLANWTDAFKVTKSPWLRSDWESVLTIMWKLLRFDNRIDDNCGRDKLLTFQEMLNLVESAYGVPQFFVACDTKQAIPENQLSIFVVLCALRYSTPTISPSEVFSSTLSRNINFDMDVGDSSRVCAGCNNCVSIVERCIVDEKVWHRTCLKCFVCRRQVYRGAFALVGTLHVECVEHIVYRILYNDPMYQPELTMRSMDSACDTLNNSKLVTPPPRPPPPKIGRELSETSLALRNNESSDRLSYSESSTVAESISIITPTSAKPSPVCSEKNWELLSYPTELNPFGSDDEDDECTGFNIDLNVTSKTASSNNPFFESEDEDDEEEVDFGKKNKNDDGRSVDNDDEEEEEAVSDLEEVENPVDRVVSSSGTFSPAKSDKVESPLNPFDESETEDTVSSMLTTFNSHETPTASDETLNAFDKNNNTNDGSNERSSKAERPSKPPRFSDADSVCMSSPRGTNYFALNAIPLSDKKYIAPIFFERHKEDKFVPGSTIGVLSDHLRRLHWRWSQLEITGQRLETQVLRCISGDKFDWKKSKAIDEYLKIIERKCEAFRMESCFVRKYLNLFVNNAHDELEHQMRGLDESNSARNAELTELLVFLLQIKNDLLAEGHSTVIANTSGSFKAVKKFTSPSLFKKGVKQTMKTLKKKL